MSGMDALLHLRGLCSKGLQPGWSEDRQTLHIGPHAYPRGIITPYRVRSKTQFYPLDALVLLLEDASKEKSSAYLYLQETSKQNVIAVPTLQRKELLQYLRGEVDSTPNVDVAGFDASGAGAVGAAQTTAAGAAGGAAGDSSEAVGGTATTDSGDAPDGGDRASKRQRLGHLAPPVKPVAEWGPSDIAREEVPLSTHLSVLQAPRKNVGHLLEFYHKATGSGSARAASASSSSSAVAVKSEDRKSSSSGSGRKPERTRSAPAPHPTSPNFGVPIIVVPAAVSSLINMYNVTHLLENGVFVSGEKIRADQPSLKKPTVHTISRSSYYDASRQVSYQVIDDVSHLKEEDWGRVVAVFVLGAAWQFSDWPKKRWSGPAAIFENVCAFHLHFDDEALHANIAQWRTHRLPISKSKRHGDRGVVLDFWHILTEFVAARNTQKRLNI